MPEVFANTTPLQYLHRLGRLEWLREFYGSVVVPEAVAMELDAGRRLGADVPDVRAMSWITVHAVPPHSVDFSGDIHRGEAEVLSLARRSPDALVIIDDGPARSHARELALKITGTLGVLLRAKREGLVAAVAPLLERLEEEGFHIAPATRGEVLRLAGE
jgi:hypothetical protein